MAYVIEHRFEKVIIGHRFENWTYLKKDTDLTVWKNLRYRCLWCTNRTWIWWLDVN